MIHPLHYVAPLNLFGLASITSVPHLSLPLSRKKWVTHTHDQHNRKTKPVSPSLVELKRKLRCHQKHTANIAMPEGHRALHDRAANGPLASVGVGPAQQSNDYRSKRCCFRQSLLRRQPNKSSPIERVRAFPSSVAIRILLPCAFRRTSGVPPQV